MTDISKMTDEQLQAEYDRLDAFDYDDLTVSQLSRMERIEREQDARELWNSDDDRVRESVGNYRPSGG